MSLKSLEIVENPMPKPTKEGYSTQPNWSDLKRMTKEELQSVTDFKIENDYGSIEFIQPVDLTYCDLAQLVTISATEIEVYPIDTQKPARGEKLNNPAIMTLYGGVKPSAGQTAESKEQ
jgi:Nucleoporin autopeptidase